MRNEQYFIDVGPDETIRNRWAFSVTMDGKFISGFGNFGSFQEARAAALAFVAGCSQASDES